MPLKMPPGTSCTLAPYVTDRSVNAGDYVVSSGGSGYLVTVARLVRGHANRWHLACVRCRPDDIPSGATVHPLFWFKRQKKRR